MKKEPLTFEKLRKSNKKRCEKYFHKINDWDENAWACALAGEVGELCNFIKKRHRAATSKSHINLVDTEHLRKEAKKEIGDALCYLDLLSTRLGFRLEDCVRDKFNEISDRYKVKMKI